MFSKYTFVSLIIMLKVHYLWGVHCDDPSPAQAKESITSPPEVGRETCLQESNVVFIYSSLKYTITLFRYSESKHSRFVNKIRFKISTVHLDSVYRSIFRTFLVGVHKITLIG